MNKVLFSYEAKEDLKAIKKYLNDELENPVAAASTVKSILNCAKQLENFPLSGTPLDNVINVKTDYRYISSGNYLVFYVPEKDKVKIVRVIHGSRDFPHLLF